MKLMDKNFLSLPALPGLISAAILASAMLATPVHAQEDEFEDDFFEDDFFEDDFFFLEEEQVTAVEVPDPFESYNRFMFRVNDKIYRYVMNPVARGFRVVPEPARVSISNFYQNLGTPVSGVNALLQLDVANAGTEFTRFLINSTIGLLGFFDPATNMGFEAENEDLGQTLARYGVDHGFFLVLPVFGPSSLRDGVGTLGNAFMDPLLYTWDPSFGEYAAFYLIEAETALSLDKDTYEAFYDSSLDPYAFFRSSYIQTRSRSSGN